MATNIIQLFSKTQIFFICLGVLAQISFFDTLRYFFERGVWGYPKLGWLIPQKIVHLGFFEVNSTTVITLHAATSFLLYGGVLCQLGIMLFVRPSPAKARFHKLFGRTLAFVCLPIFALFALILNSQMIQSPANQLLFGVIPLLVLWGFIQAICAARSHDQTRHIDAVYLILMCLNAAAITRLCVGLLYAAGLSTTFLMQNQEPAVIGPIFRTVLLILILSASYLSCDRFKANYKPILLLGTFLGVAIWVA
ncbi:DUF2306 domain-containing protein [Alcaligenaceae bacterium LF4-65]|uniref:DUF2306 domain-containing protein n=1 Tax=Zwartia hollandica TaxID=324606 RepID=A0A953ND26_9BURK|nr:DUF2306 domain-containing protein [Zwartia hollandica]MBZ1351001.1 DUF2306 domain-containing protein [Zwartia hollandica]